MMSAFTVRLPDETVAKLDQLAEKVDRSRSYVAAQAIEDYVAREEWQLAEIEAGLSEADRGEFASEKELADVIAKYVKPGLGRSSASGGPGALCGGSTRSVFISRTIILEQRRESLPELSPRPVISPSNPLWGELDA